MAFLCKIGLHNWKDIPNTNALGNLSGGKPVFRVCSRCNKRQHWDYDTARVHGVIIWVDEKTND